MSARNARSLRRSTDNMMPPLQRYSNLGAVVLPFLAFLAAIVLLWNRTVGWSDLGDLRGHVRAHRLGITVGFHRLLTHRAFQTYKPVEYAFAVARLDGGPGPGHRLGRRPPQAPRAHRRGGRPALAARPRRRAAARSPGSGTRTWAGCSTARPGRPRAATRRDLVEDRGMRRINRCFLGSSACSAAAPVRRRLRCSTATLAGALTGAAVGRLRARLHAPPRHLVDQLGLPLLRRAAASTPTTSPRNVFWLALPRSARPGTTTTTRSRARPSTACAGGSSTPRRL